MHSYYTKLITINTILKIIFLSFLIFMIFTVGASWKYNVNDQWQADAVDVEMAKEYRYDEAVNRLVNASTRLASSERVPEIAHSMANDMTNQEIKNWLNQFGTAQVNVNFNKKLSLKESSIDWLIPWHESLSHVFFSQFGFRNKDSRNTLNIGAGARIAQEAWMYGFNTFYDNDFTGHNQRIGFGVEAWADYLQLSANGYFRLNGWHQSRDFSDYNERPVSGGDLRAKAYLPAHPQLGGKLIYEQYSGERVALFGKDNLQRNPYAVTAGLNYTPIPLFTLGVDQRMGKSRKHETQWNFQMDYRLGESFYSQVSSSAIAGTRLLTESRYNLVERNNNIVLDYQKKNILKLILSPVKIVGQPGQSYPISARVQAQYGVKHIVWNDANWVAAGGKLIPFSATQFSLLLPPYQRVAQTDQTAVRSHAEQAANTYTLSAVAVDDHGNRSNSSELTITIQQPQFWITSAVIGDGAPADGRTAITVEFTVTNADKMPIVGKDVVITASHGALPSKITGKTEGNGIARIALTNTTAGPSIVTLDVEGQQQSVNIRFTTDSTPDITRSRFTVSEPDIVADGTMSSILSFVPLNKDNNFISGIKDIDFIQSGVPVTISAVTENIDHYTATLTGDKVGYVTITPQVDTQELSTLQQKITLFPVPKITNIAVNGEQFATDRGFPKTAFEKATFQLVMNDNITNNTQYDWTSSFASHVAVNNQGRVTFIYKPFGTLTVAAKSKKFPSYTVSYQFKPNLWIYSTGKGPITDLEASRKCQGSDQSTLIDSSRATNGARAPDGTLWGEWGSLTAYGSGWSAGEYWTKKTSTDFIVMDMTTGTLQSPSVTAALPLCANGI